MRGLSLLVALALGPAPPADDLPPGGYWRLGERREPEPNDGEDNLLVGGILGSLGLLRTASGVAQVYVASPEQCPRLEPYGIEAGGCPQLRAYGWAGVGFGGLFLATGVTLLAIGGAQRKKHRAWKRRYGLAMRPALGRDRFGVDLAWRF